jgi:catechol 2,3-dioxygenase-like lactoylglutathione lyase family enzyme
MRIRIISIPVQDQEVALQFYTEKLGFVKKLDIPLGQGNRWLTVVAEEEQDGPELLLEPSPKLGVEFSMKPTDIGAAKIAVFNDSCGNHIQIVEPK